MTTHRFFRIAIFAAAALFFIVPDAFAQDADAPMDDAPADAPIEDMPADTPKEEAPPVEEAPMEGAAPRPRAARPAAEALPPANVLAVQALLDSKPTTPLELFRVIYLLVELQRPDAAASLVKRFLDANPPPADMAAILREHGSAGLIRLGRGDPLGTDGKKMVDLVLNGARQHARDP